MSHLITRTIYGVEVEIDFDYSPGRPMTMYERNGDPGDPPEPAEVTINSISVGGQDLTDVFSQGFTNEVERVCYEEGLDLHNEAKAEARAEYRGGRCYETA